MPDLCNTSSANNDPAATRHKVGEHARQALMLYLYPRRNHAVGNEAATCKVCLTSQGNTKERCKSSSHACMVQEGSGRQACVMMLRLRCLQDS